MQSSGMFFAVITVLSIVYGYGFRVGPVLAESTPDRAEALQIKAESTIKNDAPMVTAPPTTQASETPAKMMEIPVKVGDPAPKALEPAGKAIDTAVKSEVALAAKLEGAPVVHLIDEKIKEALDSFYSEKLYKLIKKWPPENIDKNWEGTKPVWIRGIRTEGNSTYIGTEKQMIIHASLKNVSSIVQDFEAYPSFFHELKFVHIIGKEGNKITTSWERYSPAFFIPNIKYQQIYIVDANEKRVMIRYQLKSADSINFADGFLVLDAEGESTRLTAFDFFDARWGIFGGLASGKIWHESFQNSVKDDIALKTHAEHPEWTRDQIFKESDRILELYPVDPIQYAIPPDWGSY